MWSELKTAKTEKVDRIEDEQKMTPLFYSQEYFFISKVAYIFYTFV